MEKTNAFWVVWSYETKQQGNDSKQTSKGILQSFWNDLPKFSILPKDTWHADYRSGAFANQLANNLLYSNSFGFTTRNAKLPKCNDLFIGQISFHFISS